MRGMQHIILSFFGWLDLSTMGPQFNESLYNKVLGITNCFFLTPVSKNIWKKTSV